jgi:hypothetical protein
LAKKPGGESAQHAPADPAAARLGAGARAGAAPDMRRPSMTSWRRSAGSRHRSSIRSVSVTPGRHGALSPNLPRA